MKLQGLISAATLALATSLPLAAQATAINVDDLIEQHSDGVLYPKAKWNRDLEEGSYGFASAHVGKNSTFFDEWKFTLAENSNVSISLFDFEFPIPGGNSLKALSDNDDKKLGYGHGHGHHGGSAGPLLDNKFLTFSLFDQDGNLLGAAGEDGTLSALNLLGGQWYKLTVSAKVNGLLGSVYYGNVEVQPVPLGDALPLFGSALLVLAIRARKKLA